ncbi:aldehyde dehydrogenase family protein [Microvirga sp. GCM10011540]|uniref:aldehyde dehydrogenase family protein n=1 Tax=Microvirga sp. GCM10011540 TaxID=3317338 RepID=UPI00360BEEE3
MDHPLAEAGAVYKSHWSQGPIERRLEVLSRLVDLIDSRSEELARVAVRDMGKRISEARWEAGETAKIARYFADNAARMLAPEKIETDQGYAWIEFQPIGVVVAIEPWSFPFRGGLYSEGPAQPMDSQEPHLRNLLAFMGINDVIFLRAEKPAFGPEAREQAIETLRRQISETIGEACRKAA